MSEDTIDANEQLVAIITDAVRRERQREHTLTPAEEKLRLRYNSALRSMNHLTEKEAGQLLRSAGQLGL